MRTAPTTDFVCRNWEFEESDDSIRCLKRLEVRKVEVKNQGGGDAEKPR